MLYRWSKSQQKCVCRKTCSSSPNVAQNLTNCECFCKEKPICNNAQWFDDWNCRCRCFRWKNDVECPAPLEWSDETCGCECPVVNQCFPRQIALKPNCTCGCRDPGAEDFCLQQGESFKWSNDNCSCGTALGGMSKLTDVVAGAFSALTGTSSDSVVIEDDTVIGYILKWMGNLFPEDFTYGQFKFFFNDIKENGLPQ